MAKVKGQVYDGSEEIYTDRAGKIHSFGEFLRWIMPSAYPVPWLTDEQIARKSSRGYKPPQQGLGSASQVMWRQCFQQCADRWNALPDVCPQEDPGPVTSSKKNIWDAKQDQGVMCSYFDLYMSCCLSSCTEISITGPGGAGIRGGAISAVEGCWPCLYEGLLGDFVIFYTKAGSTHIASLTLDNDSMTVTAEQDVSELGISPFTGKVFCHSKRFMHNVQMYDGPTVRRALYLVAMSFQLTTPLPSFPGWIAFISANPSFALVTASGDSRLRYTAKLASDLVAVNLSVNHGHGKRPDSSLDEWSFLGPGEAGDCEDFALTKAQALLDLGYSATAIHLAAGKLESGQGHAWLVVQTTAGDFALDVLIDAVPLESDLPYTDVQRQVGRLWKSMSILDSFKNAIYAGYGPRDPKVWWYIYDPLINKFSLLFDSAQNLPFINEYWSEGITDMSGTANFFLGPRLTSCYNACNFSLDDNFIYISQTVGGFGFAYALHYKEISPGQMWHITNAAYNIDHVVFIDRLGNVRFVQSNGPNHFTRNLHSGLLSDSFLAMSVQISSPDDYYDVALGLYEVTNLSFSYPPPYLYVDSVDSATVGTLPFASSWTWTTHTVFYEIIDGYYVGVFVSYVSYSGSTSRKERGLFFKDSLYFVDRCDFTVSAVYNFGDNPLPLSVVSCDFSFTIQTPFGESIPCGESTDVPPDGYSRKWPLPWFHLQGEAGIIQSFLLSTTATWGVPFTESTSRIYKDGEHINAALAAAAGVSITAISGLIYAPPKKILW